MADVKSIAETLVNLTVKEVQELATVLKDEYGIEPAAAAVVMGGGGGGEAAAAKTSFDAAKLAENANELLNTIVKLKPSSAKGAYVKSVFMSSTMSAGIALDTKSFN